MLFGDDGGDDVEGAEHVHGLGLDDGHEHHDAARLEVFDGGLHGIEAGLVHEADEFHADDDYLGIIGHVFHHLFEFVDGAKEDGAIEALDEDVLAHLVGDAALVVPGHGFVEVGQAGVWQAFAYVGRGHSRGAVATLDQVAGALVLAVIDLCFRDREHSGVKDIVAVAADGDHIIARFQNISFRVPVVIGHELFLAYRDLHGLVGARFQHSGLGEGRRNHTAVFRRPPQRLAQSRRVDDPIVPR